MILITYGTRPEYLKVKPLIDEMKKNDLQFYTLFTGQHRDIAPDDADFNLDMNYVISNNRLDTIIGNVLKYGNEIYGDPDRQFEYVLVQGDTTSVVAIALSAFNHGKKVIHLEAGLRTYDKQNPFPEEINRRIVSTIADIHLCPTERAHENLLMERITGETYVVGNTVLDNLLPWKHKVKNGGKVLITLHRRENHSMMKEWFIAINEIAMKYGMYDFIFPLHPNPNVQKYKEYLNAPNIKVIDPVSHEELLDILVESALVISDSGGIQEECSFFNKYCLLCRKITERPEAVGQSTVLVQNPNILGKLFSTYIKESFPDYECPFGDGHSSEKIVEIFKQKIYGKDQ